MVLLLRDAGDRAADEGGAVMRMLLDGLHPAPGARAAPRSPKPFTPDMFPVDRRGALGDLFD